MRPTYLAAALACLVALGAAPAAAQSTTKRAPDASTSTEGSENMKPRHEFDPYSTGATPKRGAKTAETRKSDAAVQRFDRVPAATPN